MSYGSIGGSAAAPCGGTQGTRTPEVQGALDRLNGNVECLANRLQVLTNRVQPLLAQTDVGSDQSSDAARRYSCSLAAGIGAQADRVGDFATEVEGLLSRLEI